MRFVSDRFGSLTAIHRGRETDASSFLEAEWEALKNSYSIGDILMPCCQAPAIPKTSPNGLHFFAHHNGECSTAPETIWHQEAKFQVAEALKRRGIAPQVEFPDIKRKWKADVYFEHGGQRYAIEIQKSYQHLREYLRRQDAYCADAVKTYWLLHMERYVTLNTAMAKHRLKHEFGGKFPVGGFFAGLSNLPVVFATDNPFEIKGAGSFAASCDEWIAAIITDTFIHENGIWRILGHPLMRSTSKLTDRQACI